MKKILLGLNLIPLISLPTIAITSCSNSNKKTNEKADLKIKENTKITPNTLKPKTPNVVLKPKVTSPELTPGISNPNESITDIDIIVLVPDPKSVKEDKGEEEKILDNSDLTPSINEPKIQTFDDDSLGLKFRTDGVLLGTTSGFSSTILTIPRSINWNGRDIAITSIGDKAFQSKNIISLVIPNSIVSIGGNAFSKNKITSLVIPDSVTHIGERAFRDNELVSLKIPKSITTIKTDVFAANKLTSITLPNSIKIIEGGAFYSNELNWLIVPNSVTSIGDEAFKKNQLASSIFHDSLTNIGNGAFEENKLSSINIPNSVKTIGSKAFAKNRFARGSFPNLPSGIKAGDIFANQSER